MCPNCLIQEERQHKLILLIMPDVELPPSLEKLPRAYYTTDPDCYDRLTKLLSSRKLSSLFSHCLLLMFQWLSHSFVFSLSEYCLIEVCLCKWGVNVNVKTCHLIVTSAWLHGQSCLKDYKYR